MEGESNLLMLDLQIVTVSSSSVGHVADELKAMASTYVVCQFVACPIQSNNAAHILALNAMSYDYCKIWMEESPSCIVNIVADDVPII